MKKYIIKYAVMACLSLGLTGTTASCTDYLDKAPESDVTPKMPLRTSTIFRDL